MQALSGIFGGVRQYMSSISSTFIRLAVCAFLLGAAVYGADSSQHKVNKASSTHISSINNDIAFLSVMGSRPSARRLRGFQYAVLYNARGEVVRKIEMGSDSIYSLDKMIQENRVRGPLVVRMYRRR